MFTTHTMRQHSGFYVCVPLYMCACLCASVCKGTFTSHYGKLYLLSIYSATPSKTPEGQVCAKVRDWPWDVCCDCSPRLLLENRSFTLAYHFVWIPLSPRNSPVSVPQCWDYRCMPPHTALYLSTGGQKLICRACTTNLITEPSPQPWQSDFLTE